MTQSEGTVNKLHSPDKKHAIPLFFTTLRSFKQEQINVSIFCLSFSDLVLEITHVCFHQGKR